MPKYGAHYIIVCLTCVELLGSSTDLKEAHAIRNEHMADTDCMVVVAQEVLGD